jgi:hypothetical protein
MQARGFTPGATMQIISFEPPVVHCTLSLGGSPAHLVGSAADPGGPTGALSKRPPWAPSAHKTGAAPAGATNAAAPTGMPRR